MHRWASAIAQHVAAERSCVEEMSSRKSTRELRQQSWRRIGRQIEVAIAWEAVGR